MERRVSWFNKKNMDVSVSLLLIIVLLAAISTYQLSALHNQIIPIMISSWFATQLFRCFGG
jgi:hypothetical protein